MDAETLRVAGYTGASTIFDQPPCRACLCMVLGNAIGAVCLLEQPRHKSTGGMETHAAFKDMCRRIRVWPLRVSNFGRCPEGCTFSTSEILKVYRTEIYMSAFQALTEKPTHLYANHKRFRVARCILCFVQPAQHVACPVNKGLQHKTWKLKSGS